MYISRGSDDHFKFKGGLGEKIQISSQCNQSSRNIENVIIYFNKIQMNIFWPVQLKKIFIAA